MFHGRIAATRLLCHLEETYWTVLQPMSDLKTDRRWWQPDLSIIVSAIVGGTLAGFAGWISATVNRDATIKAAATAAAGSIHAADTTASASVRVEAERDENEIDQKRKQLEADVILKAIQAPTQAEAIKSLKFFSKIGLIPDYEKKVLSITSEDGGAAVPSSPSSVSVTPNNHEFFAPDDKRFLYEQFQMRWYQQSHNAPGEPRGYIPPPPSFDEWVHEGGPATLPSP